MKRIFVLLLTVVVAIGLFPTSVFAMQSRWKIIKEMSPEFGTTYYACTITCAANTTEIACTLTLYEKTGSGSYKEVSRVSETFRGDSHCFEGYYNINQERSYRLIVSGTVTCNGTTEDISGTFYK